MKENTVLHALLYIFKTQERGYINFEGIGGNISADLCDAGFEQGVADKAIKWILDLSHEVGTVDVYDAGDTYEIMSGSVRIYSPYESELFDVSCRGYLLSLEQRGILVPINREQVIAQTMALHDSGIDVSLLKWVAMMVLYNHPDPNTRSLAELLALEEMEVSYH